MPVHQNPDGVTVAECPRCEARFTSDDADAAQQWMAAHWRVHDGEIGCGRRG